MTYHSHEPFSQGTSRHDVAHFVAKVADSSILHQISQFPHIVLYSSRRKHVAQYVLVGGPW